MRAVGYQQSLPIDQDASLIDVDLPQPEPGPRDLLVEIKAVSVNPVDTKVRMRAQPEAGGVKVLGFDAAGIVRAVGARGLAVQAGRRGVLCRRHHPAGHQCGIPCGRRAARGRKPKSLELRGSGRPAADHAHRLGDPVRPARRRSARSRVRPMPLLIVGAAGGVGSVAIQLARHLTDLTVIATASRPETQAWAKELGAHHVIDHSQPLAAAGRGPRHRRAGLRLLDHPYGRRIFRRSPRPIAPQGRFALIDDPRRPSTSAC